MESAHITLILNTFSAGENNYTLAVDGDCFHPDLYIHLRMLQCKLIAKDVLYTIRCDSNRTNSIVAIMTVSADLSLSISSRWR